MLARWDGSYALKLPSAPGCRSRQTEVSACEVNGLLGHVDANLAMSYLEHSIRLGNKIAVAAACNISTSLQPAQEFQSEGAARDKLKDIAVEDLLGHMIYSFEGWENRCVAASKWRVTDRRSYAQYVDSDKFRQIRAVLPAFILVQKQVEVKDLPFDSNLLSAYKATGAEFFDFRKQHEFQREIRDFNCLNQPGPYGLTILQLAVLRRDEKFVRFLAATELLRLGADPLLRMKNQMSALGLATWRLDGEVVRTMLRNETNTAPGDERGRLWALCKCDALRVLTTDTAFGIQATLGQATDEVLQDICSQLIDSRMILRRKFKKTRYIIIKFPKNFSRN